MIKDIFDLYGNDFSTISLENYEKTVQSNIFIRLTENNRVVVLIILLSKYTEGANYADYFKQWTLFLAKQEKEKTICLCGTKTLCAKFVNINNNNLIFLCDACQIKFTDAKTEVLPDNFGKKDWICPICGTVEKCYILKCKTCEKCQICKKNAINKDCEIICEDCCKIIEKKSEFISEKIKIVNNAKKELDLKIQLLQKETEQFTNKELTILNQNMQKKEQFLFLKRKQEEEKNYHNHFEKIINAFEKAVDISDIVQIKKLYLHFCNIKRQISKETCKRLQNKFNEFLSRNVQKKEGYTFCVKCIAYVIPEKLQLAYCFDCSFYEPILRDDGGK